MKQITEAMNEHEKWYEEARVMTLEKLPEFVKKLTEEYEHDYGTICHAMASAAIATMWAIDKTLQGGVTGFQASAIMWEFIRHWNCEDNKIGLKLIDYDHLLFPQYHDRFDKIITTKQWNAIQKEAKKMLEDKEHVHIDVMKHWQSIVDGIIPFGFKVVD